MLNKLGVKFVTRPTECTHLLVRSVVRTEKFLCAMAVAPFVLSEKWATMSAANRKLFRESPLHILRFHVYVVVALAHAHCTAEEQYTVKDEATEKKYNFRLTEALARAKDNAGQLFAGIQFYVTPKVPVETKLLRNVVTANGGQVRTASNSSCAHGHADGLV